MIMFHLPRTAAGMRASAGIGPCALMPRSRARATAGSGTSAPWPPKMGFHPRGGVEDVGVLVAEDAVLTGVRVQSAYADSFVRLAQGADEGASEGEDVVGPLRGAVLDGLLQGDVGGEVEDVQFAGGQYEAEIVDTELMCEQFGVSGPLVPS